MATIMRDRLRAIEMARVEHPLLWTPRAIASSTSDLRLWMRWVIASVIGGIGGGVLALSLDTETSITALVIVGATAAAGQWLVLKRYLPNVRWWVLLSAIGGGVGAVIVLFASLAMGLAIGILVASTSLFDGGGGTLSIGGVGLLSAMIVAGLGQGAAIGFFQWLILRGKVYRAERWITVSAVGSLAAGAASLIAPAVIHLDRLTVSILNAGISQGVAAAVTGVILVRLLASRISGE